MSLVLLLGLVLTSSSMAAVHNKIDERLASSLSSRGSANVLVSFKERTSVALASLMNNTYSSRSERLDTVASTLESFAEVSQKLALEVLSSLSFKSYKILWITNQIYLRGANKKILDALVGVDNVEKITEEITVQLSPLVDFELTMVYNNGTPEWGIVDIGATTVWKLPEGNQGEGIAVGSLDTGVWGKHPDLKGNYVGEYGWLDVTSTAFQSPMDDNGHGTHTTGTMVGINGIGVAPKANWMACKCLDKDGSGTDVTMIACGQFMLCPTLPDGSSKNCSKAPRVINNSWVFFDDHNIYDDVIKAWHAANIIPVFANGNYGPECGTASYPAESRNVIAVGACNRNHDMAKFSSKGPTILDSQLVKPDITAPGVRINSAWIDGLHIYAVASGTSMATPHVSGVIALLLSNNKRLKFQQIRDALLHTTNKKVTLTGFNCGGVNESSFPNFAAGFGIVNATAAFQAVIKGP